MAVGVMQKALYSSYTAGITGHLLGNVTSLNPTLPTNRWCNVFSVNSRWLEVLSHPVILLKVNFAIYRQEETQNDSARRE
jgi:hypothetical protein